MSIIEDAPKPQLSQKWRVALLWLAVWVASIIVMFMEGGALAADQKVSEAVGGPGAIVWSLPGRGMGGWLLILVFFALGFMAGGWRGRSVRVLAGRALALAGGMLLVSVLYGAWVISQPPHGAFANTQGAGWTVGEKVVLQHPWSDAKQVELFCRRLQREKNGKAEGPMWPEFAYIVTFADGRTADLAHRKDGQPDMVETRAWVASMTPIDRAVRAQPGVVFTGDVDEGCVLMVAGKLGDPSAGQAFAALMAGVGAKPETGQ